MSSESSEEEEKNSVVVVVVEEVREVEWVCDELRLYKELKFFMMIDEDVEREGWL